MRLRRRKPPAVRPAPARRASPRHDWPVDYPFTNATFDPFPADHPYLTVRAGKRTAAELAFHDLLIAATHYEPMSQDELYRRRVEIERANGYDHWISGHMYSDGHGGRRDLTWKPEPEETQP